MPKSDYEIGKVISVTGNKPTREVKRINPYAEREGTVFRKQYENAAAIGTSAPTNVWAVNISESDRENFYPFNHLEINNLSGVNIEVRFNGSITNKEIILSGTSKIWGSTDKLLFENLDIYNRSGVTDVAISEVVLIVSRVNR